MTALRETIIAWVDQRMKDMLDAPRMWGSDEAVEMQALLLLELRALALRPDMELGNRRRVLDAYTAYVNKTFPETPNRPLCQIVESDDLGHHLAAEFRRFLEAFGPNLRAGNAGRPFVLVDAVEVPPPGATREAKADLPHSIEDASTVSRGERMSDPTSYPYATYLDVKFPPLSVIDVPGLVQSCTDRWYNQTLCKVNDSVLRLGIMQGEYHWHKHDDDDELFFVLEGKLFVDLEDRSVELSPRQGFVVPKGVVHRTRAPERAVILMMETAAIVPTGS